MEKIKNIDFNKPICYTTVDRINYDKVIDIVCNNGNLDMLKYLS